MIFSYTHARRSIGYIRGLLQVPFLQFEVLDVCVCSVALMLRVDDESAGTEANKQVTRTLAYTSSPHGLAPGRRNKRRGACY